MTLLVLVLIASSIDVRSPVYSAVLNPPNVTSITGELKHDSLATINGIYFGQKATPAPLVRDDFSVGNNGDLLSARGWLVDSDNPDYDKPQLSSAKLRHINSVNSAKFHFTRATSPLQDVAYKQGIPVTGTKRYVDYWMWYQMPVQTSGQPQHQLKLFKLQTGNGSSASATGGPGVDGYPLIDTYAWRYITGNRSTYFPVLAAPSVGPSLYAPINFTDGAWVHVRMVIDVGTEGAANGTLKVWFDDTLVINRSDVMMVAAGYGTLPWFNNFQIGKYLGNTDYDPQSETTIYYSEVYYDTTWSRVEIGDNAVYDSCKHREIQVPQGWSDGQITFKVNQGSFSSTEPAFLFVIDALGNVSNPISVSFSGLPPAPANLKGTVIQK
jgi:hypothetical protein